MKPVHVHITVLFINFIILICYSNSHKSKEPLWTWVCENEKCIPSKASQTQDKPQSLETCNMLCSPALLWPLPTGQVSLASIAVPVRSDLFQMEVELASTNIVQLHLRDAFQLFKKELRKIEGVHGNNRFRESHMVIVRFTVKDSGDPYMRINTNESYQISLKPASSPKMTLIAEIEAPSFCGARHALETLRQLIWLDHYVGSSLMIQEAIVNDEPRFGYRGLMIDTARNHIPFSEILRTIDGMAASKLNTLHWHASDSQAFSIRLDSVPELTKPGYYSPSDVYTTDQVQALVQRARLRGVRIIIEIDTPAHISQAWNWGTEYHGDVAQCTDSEPWNLYCLNPPCGQLNPLNPYVLEALQGIYSEIIRLTGVDDIFHLGADDVSESCWKKHLNRSDPMMTWQEFTRSVLQRLELVNEKMPNLTLLWSSNLSERIKTDLNDLSHIMGVQIRNPTWDVKLKAGLRTVISHEDAWDLNTGHGAWDGDKRKAPFNSWQRFYEHRPWVKTGRDNIEGGEATLWSWTVGEGGLDASVWPRAAALAERLWTDHAEGATRTVHARLDMHRARLAVRGVKCAPIWSYWCTQNPYTCN